MSKIEVDAIDKQSGSTLTLGGSGTAVTLASGATQTGFGRTGTVDWQTAIKTNSDSPLTVANGKGYFLNTTSGTITVNLPAGVAGDIVAFKDYAKTWDTNAVTVTPNGTDKIGGENNNATLNTENQSVTLIFTDSTRGWLDIHDSSANIAGQSFVTATGGTITTVCTNFKVHTFTGPGTFQVTCAGNVSGSNTVDYMVTAGGGGSPESAPPADYNYANGGGAGGGFRESSGTASGGYTASPLGSGVSALPVSVTSYPITVGGGGAAGAPGSSIGTNGSNSIFSSITSAGGGRSGSGGSSGGNTPTSAGAAGGSGGGAGANTPASAGAGNTPPVTPPQGNTGGGGTSGGATAGGGGGGATVAGGAADGQPGSPTGGSGGTGATTSITASPVAYAGGGGGGSSYTGGNTNAAGGAAGVGGGGAGKITGTANSGTANTGGGAGGVGGSCSPNNGGAGGSGVVIIRYKFQ